MAGIMDFFRSAPSSEASANQQPAPAAPAAPDATQIAADQNKPVDPLAAYGKLYEESKETPNVPPSFNLDPALINKTAASLDFMQGIPKDLVTAATNGDTAALMQMMNAVGQKSYEAAMAHNSRLTGQFVDARSKFDMEQSLAPRVRQELTSQALTSAPNYSNPVIREKLNEEAGRIQKAYPEASPQEVARMAQQYIIDLAAALNPNAPNLQTQEQGGEMDWSKYLMQ